MHHFTSPRIVPDLRSGVEKQKARLCDALFHKFTLPDSLHLDKTIPNHHFIS